MITIDAMRELLWSVPRSYDDFVSAMLDFHWDDEKQRLAMYNYILNHPEANSGDVIEYMDQFLDLYDFEKEGYPAPELLSISG